MHFKKLLSSFMLSSIVTLPTFGAEKPQFTGSGNQSQQVIYRDAAAPLPQDLPLVQLVRGPNQQPLRLDSSNPLAVIPQTPKAPSFLTLEHSYRMRDVCQVLMTDEVAVALSNVFTNVAYREAVELYAIHGDRFIKPFTDKIISILYGTVEGTVFGAAGLGDLLKSLRKLSGFDLSGKSHVPSYLRSKLPQHIIDILRLKPVTNYANKHLIGPHVVAPNVAYAIDQIQMGRLIQSEIFKRLHDKLDSFQDDLVEKSDTRLNDLRSELVSLGDELQRQTHDGEAQRLADEIQAKKAELKVLEETVARENEGRWAIAMLFNSAASQTLLNTCSSELCVLETTLTNKNRVLEEMSNKIEALRLERDGIIRVLQRAQSSQDVVLLVDSQPNFVACLERIPLFGDRLEVLMKPCPHIQPGFLSSVLTTDNAKRYGSVPALVAHNYLRLSGTVQAVHSLRHELSIPELRVTFEEVAFRIGDMREIVQEMQNAPMLPAQEELEGRGFVGSGLGYAWSLLRGTATNIQNTIRLVRGGTLAAAPVIDHTARVQNRLENVRYSIILARMPFNMVYNTLKFKATLGALNYVTEFVFGARLTSGNWYTAAILACVEEMHVLHPTIIPSVVGSLSKMASNTKSALGKLNKK
ncbi:MAG: hypothetical protein K2Y18_03810 [Alphaproteobacteria bacterium]|jgi:hypothetical protein|nr:hypothetical protein [Alphaproteobacteria bacterium]